jgi:hypothetical protein
MQKHHVPVRAYGRRAWSSCGASQSAADGAVDRELVRLALASPRAWHSPAWAGRHTPAKVNRNSMESSCCSQSW